MATKTIKNVDNNMWIDFVAKAKKEKTHIWVVLEPYVKEYTYGGKNGRNNI